MVLWRDWEWKLRKVWATSNINSHSIHVTDRPKPIIYAEGFANTHIYYEWIGFLHFCLCADDVRVILWQKKARGAELSISLHAIEWKWKNVAPDMPLSECSSKSIGFSIGRVVHASKHEMKLVHLHSFFVVATRRRSSSRGSRCKHLIHLLVFG